MEFTRQHNLWDPKDQKLNIKVIGAGSTGSFITLNLAKLGFEHLTVFDDDKVEEHNIPNQFYRLKDVEELKVFALGKIIEEFTGTVITSVPEKISDTFKLTDDVDLDSLVVLCTDTMESRKLVYNQIKDLPIKMLDTRLGGEGYQIYYVDLSDDAQKLAYESTLNAETVEAPCGQKSIIYCILSIAAETVNLVKRIDKGEAVPHTLKRQMNTYKILNNMEEPNGNTTS
jgi:molybdopterin/thiamine biosynthesis adenylyltransferase